MANRRRERRYGFSVAPGGGVQGTETLEETTIREVQEETEIIISETDSYHLDHK